MWPLWRFYTAPSREEGCVLARSFLLMFEHKKTTTDVVQSAAATRHGSQDSQTAAPPVFNHKYWPPLVTSVHGQLASVGVNMCL